MEANQSENLVGVPVATQSNAVASFSQLQPYTWGSLGTTTRRSDAEIAEDYERTRKIKEDYEELRERRRETMREIFDAIVAAAENDDSHGAHLFSKALLNVSTVFNF